MHITIVASGKLRSSSAVRPLLLDYMKQLSWKVTIKEIEVKSHEKNYCKYFSDALPKDSTIIALDERGKNLSSQELAQLIDRESLSGNNHFCFLIGGADGLPKSVKQSAQHVISFGKNTWPHMVVRLMLVEQIYRAQQILSGHPYHRD